MNWTRVPALPDRLPSRTKGNIAALILGTLFLFAPAHAQSSPEMQLILERLDRLEKQNAEMAEEIRKLREDLKSSGQAAESPAPRQAQALADTVAVQQARIEEQAQTKVEAASKFPIRITGMVLFNAYTGSSGGGTYLPAASTDQTGASTGGMLRQSILGLEFHGPRTVWGGRVHGDLSMDFWGNQGPYQSGGTVTGSTYDTIMPRLRTATVQIDWDSRSVMVGRERPLVSPRSPDSFAQVGVPPLSEAGNLWLWQPQVRFEQRFKPSDADTLKLQFALFQTGENYGRTTNAYAALTERSRPGWQGRFEFSHQSGDDTLYQLAPGFHFSKTHVAGQSVDSRILSVDGLARPARVVELSGTFFTGENVSGVGGLGPGYSLDYLGTAQPIHSRGGWMQLTLAPARRLSFHLFGGAQTNREADLGHYGITANVAFAGNIFYQLAPNVFAAFEASQTRTSWLDQGNRLRNHYDLALAYLF